jgi:hypothetical protein
VDDPFAGSARGGSKISVLCAQLHCNNILWSSAGTLPAPPRQHGLNTAEAKLRRVFCLAAKVCGRSESLQRAIERLLEQPEDAAKGPARRTYSLLLALLLEKAGSFKCRSVALMSFQSCDSQMTH